MLLDFCGSDFIDVMKIGSFMSLTDVLKLLGNNNITYKCPYCGVLASFNFVQCHDVSILNIRYATCVSCHGIVVQVQEILGDPDKWVDVYPRMKSICWSEFIPEEIRNDLNAAASIIDITPDAAVVLIRRALERFLKKYVKAHGKMLNDNINDVIARKLLPDMYLSCLHSLRKIGNYGAHPFESIYDEDLLLVEIEEASAAMNGVLGIVIGWFITPVLNDAMNEKVKAKESKTK